MTNKPNKKSPAVCSMSTKDYIEHLVVGVFCMALHPLKGLLWGEDLSVKVRIKLGKGLELWYIVRMDKVHI